jgi:hypothetical protein
MASRFAIPRHTCRPLMVIRAQPSLPRNLPVLVVAAVVFVVVAAACKPGGNEASPTSAATMAVTPSGEPELAVPIPTAASIVAP